MRHSIYFLSLSDSAMDADETSGETVLLREEVSESI